jgi:hypothetical protein
LRMLGFTEQEFRQLVRQAPTSREHDLLQGLLAG